MIESGGQSGCQRRIEVFGKIKKKSGRGKGLVGLGGSSRGGREDVNEELKFFVKIKNNRGGGSNWEWGVRVEVNEELNFLKIQKKKKRNPGRGDSLGVRVDVNEELKFL